MTGLEQLSLTFPSDWKWAALFVAPEGHEQEWRSWLAQAQRAEEKSLLGFWARRRPMAA